jgi:small conductance mechanosensitive channel
MFEESQVINFIDVHLIPWSIKVAVALTIFLVGQIVARLISGALEKVLSHTKLDRILIDFLGSVVRALLLVVVHCKVHCKILQRVLCY